MMAARSEPTAEPERRRRNRRKLMNPQDEGYEEEDSDVTEEPQDEAYDEEETDES